MSEPNLRFVYSFTCANCRYTRQSGFAKLTAETQATSHAIRRVHDVTVTAIDLKTLEVTKTVIDVKSRMQILPGSDAPPF